MLPLPQELIDLILDEVAEFIDFDPEVRTTLESCSVVSKAFVRRARFHLFSTIFIDWPIGYLNSDKGRPIRRLCKIMQENEHIRKCVKNLTIAVDGPAEVTNPRGKLHVIVNMLCADGKGHRGIQTLHLLGFCKWKHFSREFQNSVRRLVGCDSTAMATSLERLHLNNPNDVPLEILSRCSSLKEVSLVESTLPASPTPLLPAPVAVSESGSAHAGTHCNLETVRLVGFMSRINVHLFVLIPPGQISRINHLGLCFHTLDVPEAVYLERVWDIVGDSLKELDLLETIRATTREYDFFGPGLIAFSKLPHLRLFKSTICVIDEGVGHEMPHLGQAFRKFELSPHSLDTIHDLIIEIEFRGRFRNNYTYPYLPERGWDKLDEYLSKLTFVSLRKLHLYLRFRFDEPPTNLERARMRQEFECFGASVLPHAGRLLRSKMSISLGL